VLVAALTGCSQAPEPEPAKETGNVDLDSLYSHTHEALPSPSANVPDPPTTPGQNELRGEIPYDISPDDDPFWDLHMSEEGYYLADLASYLVAQDCMREHGFEMAEQVPRRDALTLPRDYNGMDEDWGLLSMRGASTHGYRWTTIEANEEAKKDGLFDDEPVWHPNYDPEYQDAWGKDGRCSDTGWEASYGAVSKRGSSEDGAALFEVVDRAKAKAMADQRVEDALRAWSDCMGQDGYDVDHPRAPIDHSTWTEMPKQEHLSMAIRDVECKHQVKLIETWREVFYAAEAEEFAKGAPIIEETRQWAREVVESSQKVIADYGGEEAALALL